METSRVNVAWPPTVLSTKMPGEMRRDANALTAPSLRGERNHGCRTSALARQLGLVYGERSPSMLEKTSRKIRVLLSPDAKRLPTARLRFRRRAPPDQLRLV